MDDLTISFEGKSFHTGYSRIEKYLHCPRSYKFAYVDKLDTGPPGLPLRRGQAYHASLESALAFKKDKGRELPITKLLELARYFAEQEDLTLGAVNEVQDMVKAWHTLVYPTLDPLFIEESFEITRNGVTLTGRLDLGTKQGVAVDHKASYELWGNERAKSSVQPIIYQWAWEDCFSKRYGIPFKNFEYHVCRQYPLNVQVLKLSKVNVNHSDWYEDAIREIATGMVKGIYFPKPDAIECARCSHRKVCNPVLYRVSSSTL